MRSPQLLLVAWLRAQGYPLTTERGNFQDCIRADGSRVFVFLFDGRVTLDGKTPGDWIREVREGRHWLAQAMEAWEPGKRPLQSLGELPFPGVAAIFSWVKALLIELKEAPVHQEVKRGRRTYWLGADLSGEALEREIARLDAAM